MRGAQRGPLAGQALLGHVVMQAQLCAAGQAAEGDGDHAAVMQLPFAALARQQAGAAVGQVLQRQQAHTGAGGQQVFQQDAGAAGAVGQTPQVAKALVGQLQPAIGAHQGQALGQLIDQRGIQRRVAQRRLRRAGGRSSQGRHIRQVGHGGPGPWR